MKALYWTYGLSWALALLGYALGVKPGTPAYLALGVLYMWAPGLVALLFARREGIRLPLAFRPNRYWLFAWLFPVPLTLLSVLLSLPFGAYRGLAWTFPEGPPPLPEPLLLALVLLQGLVAGATANLLAALGEELMWRGYLWERVRERGFWPATLEIGFHWGLWHAPLILLDLRGAEDPR
jgi:membrane protease YdiL (CAAX protease family)